MKVMLIQTLTVADFAETVAGADRPLLVEFSGEWCGPCRQMMPVLAALAEEMDGGLDIAVIDFDENLSVGHHYDVMSLPTLLLFINGELVRRFVGARGLAHLRQELGNELDSRPQKARLVERP